MTTLLGMFAKFWTPGRVKTRLAATIGNDLAAEFHQLFLQSLLDRLQDVADVRRLYFSPASEAEAFRALHPKWETSPQVDGDLGVRIRSFFDESFAAGFERVILIGSDSPDLSTAELNEGFTHLRNQDVVVGPSHDGGYYAIGAARKTPPLFAEISWGGDQVFQQTVQAIQSCGLSYRELAPWYDVDDIDDLRQLVERLQSSDDRRLSKLAEAIRERTPASYLNVETK